MRPPRRVSLTKPDSDSMSRHLPHNRFENHASGASALGDDEVASAARGRVAAIVDSSDDAIVSKDLNGTVMSWNRAAERLFGYSASEMIGQPIRRIIPSELQSEEDGIISRIRSGQRMDHISTVRQRKDGSRLEV